MRNFFANNFRNFEERDDKGALLENAAWRGLSDKHPNESIRFWRTIQKHEVDFVTGDEGAGEAFEVKANPDNIRAKNYRTFLDGYPGFKFSVVTIDKKSELTGEFKVLDIWEL